MRKKGREGAKWDDQSWTEYVNWDAFVDKMPLAVTYGKGVPIVKKTVYMNQWHQHVIEQILHAAKQCFRTETDLTRSIMNMGLVMYYNIFIKNIAAKNADDDFFYQSIRDQEKAWKTSDMVEVIKHVVTENSRRRRGGILTQSKEQEMYKDIIQRVPRDVRDEVLSILEETNKRNVINGTVFDQQSKVEGG